MAPGVWRLNYSNRATAEQQYNDSHTTFLRTMYLTLSESPIVHGAMTLFELYGAVPVLLLGFLLASYVVRYLYYLIFLRSKRSCEGKTFAITGASGALGSEVCLELCARGARCLIIWDVREKELEELKARIIEGYPNVEVVAQSLNLLSLKEIATATESLLKEYDVDCIIQVAGIVFADMFHVLPSMQDRATFDINFQSQVEIMRVAVPFREAINKPLHIVGVSSVAAFNGGAGMAVYAASKAALKAFYESVAMELSLRSSCVSVSLFCPGSFDSKLFRGAHVPLVRSLSAHDVAKALIYYSIMRRFPISVYPGYLSIIFIYSNLLQLVWNSFLIVPFNTLANWKGKDYACEVLSKIAVEPKPV